MDGTRVSAALGVTYPRRNGPAQESHMRSLARRLVWRAVRPITIVLWQGGPLIERPAIPAGFTWVRIRGTDPRGAELARAAMRAADDDGEGDVPQRFADGDELFGCQSSDGSLVSFIWVRFRRRAIGPVRLQDRPGRVFLYNAHTLPAFRGQGIYPVVLNRVRAILTAERATEFIADVNLRNVGSTRGMEKAGFRRFGSITVLKLFQRWDCVTHRTVDDRSAAPIFL
jgi:hypothetical protein